MEEPLFDLSDLNVAHVALFLVSLLSVLADLRVRAHYGQWGPRDTAALGGVLAFWLTLERYVAAIVTVSAAHFMLPLEAELVDVVEVYGGALTWVSGTLAPVWVLACLSLASAHAAALAEVGGRPRLALGALTLVCGLLFQAWVLLAYDLALNALSGLGGLGDRPVLYAQPRVGPTFDAWVGGADVYDWHKASTAPRAMRFEDVYCFFAALLALVATTTTLIWHAYLLVEAARPTPLGGGGLGGVGLRLHDHLLLTLGCACGGLCYGAARILLRLPAEVFFW